MSLRMVYEVFFKLPILEEKIDVPLNVGDPDVFGPPRSGSISQRFGS
jgi:hypothetical protein